MRRLDRRFRLLGWQGLVGMAVSGLDMAFWDVLGRTAGWPVGRLLGGMPSRCAPTTATAWSTRAPTRASSPARSRPVSGDQGQARRRRPVQGRRVRPGGPGDHRARGRADGGLQPEPRPGRGLSADRGLQSSTSPGSRSRSPAEDLLGHARVRAAAGVPVQTGENWWFPRDMQRALAAGACDLAMPDLGRSGASPAGSRPRATARPPRSRSRATSTWRRARTFCR